MTRNDDDFLARPLLLLRWLVPHPLSLLERQVCDVGVVHALPAQLDTKYLFLLGGELFLSQDAFLFQCGQFFQLACHIVFCGTATG